MCMLIMRLRTNLNMRGRRTYERDLLKMGSPQCLDDLLHSIRGPAVFCVVLL